MQKQQWRKSGKIEKILAWQLTKFKNKKDVIDEARNKGRKVHFASLMDLCHLKNSELEPQFQSTKAESYSEVTLGKIIQDHTQYLLNKDVISITDGSRKMDIFSRRPRCAGQADAVSAKYPGKNGRCPKIMKKKIPKSECPHIWIRLPNNKRPKSWSSMEDPVVLLERRSSFSKTIVGTAI